MLLYAGTNGYIDQYPEAAIPKYEKEMLAYMVAEHQGLLTSIQEKKQIDPPTEESLKQALDAFKGKFTY